MQAVAFDHFGGPEAIRLADRPTLEPRPGEVVIDVAAASVNPTDIMMLSGAQARMMVDLAPPYTAGMEFAGRVAQCGPGVNLGIGQAVVGVVNPRRPEGGAQAQQVRLPVALVAPINETVGLIAAAAVPMNALTAILCLELSDLSRGQSVLVTGGAGAMGGFAIQLARQAGLRVLANGGDSDHSLLSQLGADIVLPRDTGLEDALMAACPEGVDALIDAALIGARLSHRVRSGGAAVALRASHAIVDDRLRTFVVSVGKVLQEPDVDPSVTRNIERIARYIEDGTLTPRVAANGVFALRHASEAYRMAQRSGVRGRVLLVP